jgi:hypothetical protein
MPDIHDFFDSVKDLFTGTRKHTAYISLALVLMACTALIAFIIQKTRKPAEKPGERELVINEKLLVPDGPEAQKGYTVARQKTDRWSDEDIERWFTPPSKKELNDLGRANDLLIDDLTGAAP